VLETSELPQLLNPPGGYVQNCNSPPFLTTLKAPLDPAKFPPYLGANNVSLRSQHSLRLVDNDDKFTLDEVMHRKHSPGMLLAERVKGDLIAAVRSGETTPDIDSALSILAAWDDTVTADSRGSVLFTNWWQRYLAAKGKHAVEWTAADPTATPRGLADAELARKCFAEAVADVKQSYGSVDVRWGDVHRLRKQGVDLPLSGGSGLMGCFRVLEFRKDADGKQVANSGDSFVFAVEFSDPPQGYSILAYSESEIPGNPHYSDQSELFAAGKLKRTAFTDSEIAAQLLKRYHPGEE
jgi:acyl-homoserine-lactone acylase